MRRLSKSLAEFFAAQDYSKAVNIPHYGWMAVLSYLVYVLALLCSHTSAFRVATNLRLAVTEHLAKLPLGFTERYGSGKLRKVIQESTGAAETYLAHQLPDQYGAMATPVGLLVMLFVFDWRLGLLSLVPVVLGFAIMSAMTGKRMEEKMRQYGNALAAMSNEAVEYVRGIPVVKTFGQSVFSFKKFKATIDEYEKWVVAYTKDMRMPMMLYTAAINGVFAFLIAGGLLFTKSGITPEFLLNLLFYIIIAHRMRTVAGADKIVVLSSGRPSMARLTRSMHRTEYILTWCSFRPAARIGRSETRKHEGGDGLCAATALSFLTKAASDDTIHPLTFPRG